VDALELAGDWVYTRLAGPVDALEEIGRDILGRWPGEMLCSDSAGEFWRRIDGLSWTHPTGVLIKAAASFSTVVRILPRVQTLGAIVHVTTGGSAILISLPSAELVPAVDEQLSAAQTSGIVLRGQTPLWIGRRQRYEITAAIKRALDPDQKFPSLDD
jgi:hypothetical protein